MKIVFTALFASMILNVLPATSAAGQPAVAAPALGPECCAVIELRQYITYPGRRDDLITLFEREFIEPQEAVGIRVNADLAPTFERSGAQILGRFVTERSTNTFERLPVRDNVNVFVWFARFADRAGYDRYNAQLAKGARWRDELFAKLYKSLARAPETLMLEPAARSLIR